MAALFDIPEPPPPPAGLSADDAPLGRSAGISRCSTSPLPVHPIAQTQPSTKNRNRFMLLSFVVKDGSFRVCNNLAISDTAEQKPHAGVHACVD